MRMKIYDLAVAWNWEFDKDFVLGLEQECRRRGLSVYRVESHNVEETLNDLRDGTLGLRALYDRASDADEAFLPFVDTVTASKAFMINRFDFVQHAKDKATMHLEFVVRGIATPFTIIISPYSKRKGVVLSLSDLEKLGRPFIIKPASITGGGIGVVLGAETLKDVIEARQHLKNDKYLLQEKIEPKSIDGRRAWFRVFYAFGDIIPCWWDDLTHIYHLLTPEEERRWNLAGLRPVMKKIHDTCRLDFFSSEIALTRTGSLVVVDYVNEICDMRLQSKYVDGVPDAIVHRIEHLIVEKILTVKERHRK